MATISISQLDTATQASVDDLYEVAVVDENSQTGYASRKLTAAQIATLIAQGIQFSGLSTATKTIISAINEAAQNGGSEVEPNPAGEPTDTLETIGIDGTVYEVGGSEPVSKTVTGNPINITDAADAPIVSGEVTFEPVQDLHGYDKPWAGGAGKNKLPLTVDGIKALNTTGTWSGNVYSHNNATFELLTDTDNNIIGIKVNSSGTTGNAVLYLVPTGTSSLATYLSNGVSYKANGATSSSSFRFDVEFNGEWKTITSEGAITFTYTSGGEDRVRIFGATGSSINNLVFYPMIRLATETDPTFEPYSNICPIEGYTDCELGVTGKNLLPMTVDGIKTANTRGTWSGNAYTDNGVTFTVLTDDSDNVIGIKANGTASANSDILMTATTAHDWNDAIVSGCPTGGGNTTYRVEVYDNTNDLNYIDTGSGVSLPNDISTSDTRFIVQVRSGYTATDLTFYPMIRLSTETDPTFEPYQSTTYTIDLNGTRYGGKVRPGTGEVRVTYTLVDLGSLSWIYDSVYKRFYTPVIDDMKRTEPRTMYVLCSHFETISDGRTLVNIPDNSIYTGNKVIYIHALSYGTDATAFKTAMDGAQLCYELATPFTVQLTPEQIRTLEGTNNISTNMTDMTLEYITQEYQPLVKLIEQAAGHHYSTQERVVGTYFGKPLYERSYSVSTPATVDTVNQIIAVPENSVVVNIFGMYNNQFPINYYYDTTNYINTWLNNAKTHVVNKTPFNLMLNLPGIVTIQYTKTTD